MEVLHTTYKAIHDITAAPEFKVDPSKIDKNFSIFITDLFNSIEDVSRVPGPPPDVLARSSKGIIEYFQKLHQMFDFRPWFLMAILGILTAITGVFLDFGTIYLFNLRLRFLDEENTFLAFAGFYITGFVFASITTSLGVLVSPFVDGSGVPELKSIMSGANAYKCLEAKIFFPKFIGMCTAYGAGLQVGRAGPLVHLSACIANWLLKRESFKYMDKNYAMKRSILSVACGCGMTVALGAPLTGIIFCVEVVIGFVNTSNLFRTFWGICWSLVATKAMKFVISIDPLNITTFDYYQLDFDLLLFIITASLSALLGAAFLKITIKLIFLRRSVNTPIFDRYVWAWIAYTLVAVTHYPFQYALQSTRLFYNDVYSTGELVDNPKFGNDYIRILSLYMLIKCVTMPFIFSCNIPFGIFGLPLTLGAIFGRWFAEMIELTGLYKPINKGAYAVVGSASILACVVRGVFPAAMLIETTGQIEYGIPICVGVLAGYMVGNAFSLSFFDIPIYLRKLPLMASLMSKENYDKRASDLMVEAYPYILDDASHKEVFDMFVEMGEINKALLIPIVNNDKFIVGAVTIENLIDYLRILDEEEGKRMKELMQATRKTSLAKHVNAYTRWQNIERFFQKAGTAHEQEVDATGDSRVVKPSFHMKSFKPKKQITNDAEDPVEIFWGSRMDWDHPRLEFDPSPLTVTPKCYASKLQFLFTTTRATCILIAEAGIFKGCITSIAFLKQKSV